MEKDRKLAGADLLASLALIALGTWGIIVARGMKVFRTLIISPGLFPLIIGGVFVLCGLVLLIMAIKRGGITDLGRLFSAGNIAGIYRSPTFRRGLVILGLIVLYVALFGSKTIAKLNFILNLGDKILPVNTGFILITAGYLFATFSYLKAMRWTSALIVSVLAAVLIFLAFNQGFGIPIP